MTMFQVSMQYAKRFSEILLEEGENAELAVEDAMSQVILSLFGEGAVDDVTIQSPSQMLMGLQYGSISIKAQFPYSSFVLNPCTEEYVKSEVGKSLITILKELFVSVSINDITLGPSA